MTDKETAYTKRYTRCERECNMSSRRTPQRMLCHPIPDEYETSLIEDVLETRNTLDAISTMIGSHSHSPPVLMLTEMELSALRGFVSDIESSANRWLALLTRRVRPDAFAERADAVRRSLLDELSSSSTRNVRQRRSAYNNTNSSDVDSNAPTQPMVPDTTPESKSNAISELADDLLAAARDPSVNDPLIRQLRVCMAASIGTDIIDVNTTDDDTSLEATPNTE